MGFSIRTYKWYNSGHNCTMPIDTENKLDPQVPRARLDAGARHPRACTHSRLCCSGRSFPWIPMDFFAPKWIDPKLMPKLMPILVTSWWFGTCFFITVHMLGMSSSQLTDFHIFQRGRAQPPSSKHTNTLDFCCCVWNFSGRRGWRLTAKGPGSTWFHPISTVEPDFIFVLYTEALLLRSLIREPITLCLVCFVFVCLRFFLREVHPDVCR